jgi:hypothetical protein
MGVDLRLLPVDHESDRLSFSHTVLDLAVRRDWFERLDAMTDSRLGSDAPDDFSCYVAHHEPPCEETGYGSKVNDAYGRRLRCLRAKDIVASAADFPPDHAKNKAVLAYLAALPPDTKVVLDWH